MTRLKTSRITKILLASLLYIIGPILFVLTDPRKLPLPLLIGPFVWLFLVLFCTTVWSYRLITHKTVISKKFYARAGVACLLPVLLAVLQSIHQLAVSDVILVLGICAITNFYMSKFELS